MKKKNLNFLLALLAALALVFAGACSDGSDDGSSSDITNTDTTVTDDTIEDGDNTGSGNDDDAGSNTPTVEDTTVYTTYTYTIAENDAHSTSRTDTYDATYLNSVALRFADLNAGGSSVAITVEYLVCDYESSSFTTNSHTGINVYYLDTTYTWTDTATYSYVEGAQDAADTITVTLNADSDSSNAGATLTFTVDSTSGNLTLTDAKESSETTAPDLFVYLVMGTASGSTDETGCDLFNEGATTGYLEAKESGGSEFELAK